MSVGYEYICTRSMRVTGMLQGDVDTIQEKFEFHAAPKLTRVRIHFGTHFAYGGHVKRSV